MAETVVSSRAAPSPGDIRALGTGDVVVLHRSAKDRQDWTSILSALPNAIARGADVRWKKI